jgi:hypothetical protein
MTEAPRPPVNVEINLPVVATSDLPPKPKPLLGSKTISGRKLTASTNDKAEVAAPARLLRRHSEPDAVNDVELTLFRDLRAMYDTREDDDIDGVDEDLYTDLALLQREAIRLEPEVQLVITELYEAVDADGSNTIEEGEYQDLVRALYNCLRTFWDKDMAELDDEEMKEIAAEDWKVDANGHDCIDYERFVVAMFKLCDIWTDFLDGETYLDFLLALRDRMTVLRAVNGIVRRVLRADLVFTRDGAAQSEKDKVLLIVELYDKQDRRWTTDNQLGLWVSKGSNENILRNKPAEVVSMMVVKYLEKCCAAEKKLWAKTVKDCRASLHEHEVQQRKLKQKEGGAHRRSATRQMAKRNWNKITGVIEDTRSKRRSAADFTFAVGTKKTDDLKKQQTKKMLKKQQTLKLLKEEKGEQGEQGREGEGLDSLSNGRKRWLAERDSLHNSPENEANRLRRTVTLKTLKQEQDLRRDMEMEAKRSNYKELFDKRKRGSGARKGSVSMSNETTPGSPASSTRKGSVSMSNGTTPGSPASSTRPSSPAPSARFASPALSARPSSSPVSPPRQGRKVSVRTMTSPEHGSVKVVEEAAGKPAALLPKQQAKALLKEKKAAEEAAAEAAVEEAARKVAEEVEKKKEELRARKEAEAEKVRKEAEKEARLVAEEQARVRAERARIDEERARIHTEGEAAKRRAHEAALLEQKEEVEARKRMQLPQRRASVAAAAEGALAELRPMQRTWLERMTALQQRLYINLWPAHRVEFWRLEAGNQGEEQVGQRAAFLLLPTAARSQFTVAPPEVRDDIVRMPRAQQFEFFRLELLQQARMLMFTADQRATIMAIPDTVVAPAGTDMPARARDILGPTAFMGVGVGEGGEPRLSARRTWWQMSDDAQDACLLMSDEQRLYFLQVLNSQDRAKWLLLSHEEHSGFWGIHRSANKRQGQREAACRQFMETMLTLNRQVYWDLNAKDRALFWDKVPAAEREMIEERQLPVDALRLYLRSLSFTTAAERVEFLELPAEVQARQAEDWRVEADKKEAVEEQARQEELATKQGSPVKTPTRQTHAKKIEVLLPGAGMLPLKSASPVAFSTSPIAFHGHGLPATSPQHPPSTSPTFGRYTSSASASSAASSPPPSMHAGPPPAQATEQAPLAPVPLRPVPTPIGKLVPTTTHDDYEYPSREMHMAPIDPPGGAPTFEYTPSAAVDRLTELDRELEMEMEQLVERQLSLSRSKQSVGNDSAGGGAGAEAVLAVVQRTKDSPLRMAQVLEETAVGTRRGDAMRYLQKASELAQVRPTQVLRGGKLAVMCTSGEHEVQKWKERRQHAVRKGRRQKQQGRLECTEQETRKLGHERLWQHQANCQDPPVSRQQRRAIMGSRSTTSMPLGRLAGLGSRHSLRTPVLPTVYSANLDPKFLGLSLDGVNAKAAYRRPQTGSQFPPLHSFYRSSD